MANWLFFPADDGTLEETHTMGSNVHDSVCSGFTNWQNDRLMTQQYTAPVTGKIIAFHLTSCDDTTGNHKFALYDDNAGVPNNLLFESEPLASSPAPGAGVEQWFTLTLAVEDYIDVTASTVYHIGVLSDADVDSASADPNPAARRILTHTYEDAMPNPYSGGASYGTGRPVYVSIAETV